MSGNELKFLEQARASVSARVRAPRTSRRWTQKELAEKIGLSQARLSEVERGDGSFTAEQLLLIAQLFNEPVSEFAPRTRAAALHAELQNALARLGAPQLQEDDELLPSERFEEVGRAVKEALVLGAPRLVVALAPVLVHYIDRLSLPGLQLELRELGIERRLPWLAENVLDAIRAQRGVAPRELAARYRRAETVLDFWSTDARGRLATAPLASDDLLDTSIRSARTLEQVRAGCSEISRRWGIVTALQPSHFAEALEAARAGH